MIDLHSHILPGLDDGAPDYATAEALARAAADDGVRVIAATPHIREDYRFPPGDVARRSADLNRELAAAGVPVEVTPAGELALTMAPQLDDATLDGLCLGDGRWLLVESPYGHATDMIDAMVFDIQRRGYDVLLAHPERSPTFIKDQGRLAILVERGVACSVTAASVTGGFGRTIQRVALGMIEAGLVHDVASDAHDASRRPPGLSEAVRTIDRSVRGLEGAGSWFVEDAPREFLSGGGRPTPPEAARRRGRWPFRPRG